MDVCLIKTPLGITKICGGINGISSISVSNHDLSTTKVPNTLKKCVMQLQEYFEGKRQTFDLKLNPKGTDFQKQVWHLLETEVPFGKTLSYLELAKRYGNVKTIRAIANANAKNPIWIIIPCHRIIGSDGKLTGYAGGLHRKQWLINHEAPNKQKSLFL